MNRRAEYLVLGIFLIIVTETHLLMISWPLQKVLLSSCQAFQASFVQPKLYRTNCRCLCQFKLKINISRRFQADAEEFPMRMALVLHVQTRKGLPDGLWTVSEKRQPSCSQGPSTGENRVEKEKIPYFQNDCNPTLLTRSHSYRQELCLVACPICRSTSIRAEIFYASNPTSISNRSPIYTYHVLQSHPRCICFRHCCFSSPGMSTQIYNF